MDSSSEQTLQSYGNYKSNHMGQVKKYFCFRMLFKLSSFSIGCALKMQNAFKCLCVTIAILVRSTGI